MTPATLVYLHGFNSSPQTVKGRKLAVAAASRRDPPHFHIPALHHRPAKAMRDVCAWVDARPDRLRSLTFIGSSLGGYYATWLAEKYGARAIVINPVVRPFAELQAHLGPQQNPYTGECYELAREHFAELQALMVARLTRHERYFLLVRAGDEVLDWREAVARYAGAWQFVAGGGTHGWEDIDAEIPAMLRFAGLKVETGLQESPPPHPDGRGRPPRARRTHCD
ncbi:MAG: esterase [Betaproteobacteria bacterium]|nr:esterase [Betaproteobacteria bacterium]MBA3775066.1 esterase [Betaproteobacteria bacterium]